MAQKKMDQKHQKHQKQQNTDTDTAMTTIDVPYYDYMTDKFKYPRHPDGPITVARTTLVTDVVKALKDLKNKHIMIIDTVSSCLLSSIQNQVESLSLPERNHRSNVYTKIYHAEGKVQTLPRSDINFVLSWNPDIEAHVYTPTHVTLSIVSWDALDYIRSTSLSKLKPTWIFVDSSVSEFFFTSDRSIYHEMNQQERFKQSKFIVYQKKKLFA